MMVLQNLLMLSVSLLLCSGARLPRQSSDYDDDIVSLLPNTDTCGQSSVRIQIRDIGGRSTQLYPKLVHKGSSKIPTKLQQSERLIMMIPQTLLLLSATLLLCSGARLRRQSSDEVDEDILPNTDKCGLSGAPYATRIVGGGLAVVKQFPWMAALGYMSRASRRVQWNCGGSLITNQHVLTAAHCVHPSVLSKGTPRTLVKIRLGELDFDETVNDQSEPQDINVDSKTCCKWHERYRTGINDIAIVKMNTAVSFTEFIRPICLSPEVFSTNDFTGHHPKVAGWGTTYFNGPRDSRLMVADVQIKDIDECRRNITSKITSAIIDSRVICASEEGVDSCQGDSGGPLMMPIVKKTSSSDDPNEVLSVNYFLMGIVSWGPKCAVKGYPGIYVRVSTYLSWIVEHLDV